MFAVGRNVRLNVFTRPSSLVLCKQVSTTTNATPERKHGTYRTPEKGDFKVEYELAERLAATGLWGPNKKGFWTAEEKKIRSIGDKARINIVNESVCKDIISYIGPGLERHKGCDLLDIYPGAGLWSETLHNFLKPRSHILMEPDDTLYKPFLQPLLDKPNTTLVPASGLVWRDLNDVLSPKYLPHQKVPDPDKLGERNDTLLITANIAFHPKRRFLKFESVAHLVLYQFIDAIRTGALYQKYGLVRMLIWTRPDDKFGILPKVLQKRKKLSIETELSCDWVREVCGQEAMDSTWFMRDSITDAASDLATWKRMRAQGIKMPAERSSNALIEAKAASRSKEKIEPGVTPPAFKRSFLDELATLEAQHEKEIFDKDSATYRKMRSYRWRANWEYRKHQRMQQLIAGLDAINKLHKEGKASPEELKKREDEWEAELMKNPSGFVAQFITYKDGLHIYRQDPPVMFYDRRAYDRMVIQPEEFYPNVPISLLDIQPKAVHPLLRQKGPNSTRVGDCFELLLSAIMSQSILPLDKTLDNIMPGFSAYIMPRWTSLRDVKRGGLLTNTPHSQLTARMLNARQWEEFLEIWSEWPFRPTFHELIARTCDEEADMDGLYTEK